MRIDILVNMNKYNKKYKGDKSLEKECIKTTYEKIILKNKNSNSFDCFKEEKY